jgi:hypothetical protein
VTKNGLKNYRQLETEKREASSVNKTKTTIGDLYRISFRFDKDQPAEILRGKQRGTDNTAEKFAGPFSKKNSGDNVVSQVC